MDDVADDWFCRRHFRPYHWYVMIEGNHVPSESHSSEKSAFQTLLRLIPELSDDHDLETVAAHALEALLSEAKGLALGPVVSIDLDERTVEVEMTIEAASASEAHQKIGLILRALERGAPFILRDSTASQSDAATDDEPELVPA